MNIYQDSFSRAQRDYENMLPPDDETDQEIADRMAAREERAEMDADRRRDEGGLI